MLFGEFEIGRHWEALAWCWSVKKSKPSQKGAVSKEKHSVSGMPQGLAQTEALEPRLGDKEAAGVDFKTAGFTFNAAEVFRIAVITLLATFLWCFINQRFTAESWQVPLEYGLKGVDADALGVMASIKASAEGDYIPGFIKRISRLGAPHYGNWSDYPVIEDWQFFLPGLLSKWIGLFAAVNVAVLVAQVLACVVFYISARLFGCAWHWAFAGAFVFGFSRFAFAREVHHLVITNYWHVPVCLLLIAWILQNKMGDWRGLRYLFTLGFAVFVGMQNPYYTNMFIQLAVFAGIYQYFRHGWRPVFQVAGMVAAAGFGFLLMTADTLWYRLQEGANPGGFMRQYIWLELSALKFVDMLIPPPDHPLFSGLGQAYYQGVAFPGEVPPSCYLGLVAIACFVWLGAICFRRLVIEQPAKELPSEAWQISWIMAYSVVGGFNCLGGVFGVLMFRSSTRYCIFILAILLLFAARRLSSVKLDLVPKGVVCLGIALFAVFDQAKPVVTQAQLTADAQRVL